MRRAVSEPSEGRVVSRVGVADALFLVGWAVFGVGVAGFLVSFLHVGVKVHAFRGGG